MAQFKDRVEAGNLLADKLLKYAHDPNTVVLGLPRGGVVPAYEVAKRLDIPLDIIIVRKIGLPFDPELALGAITEDDVIIYNDDVLSLIGIDRKAIHKLVDAQRNEIARRVALFRDEKKPLDLKGKTAILIDDGVATGATVRAAIMSAKKRGAARIVVALPVAPTSFKDEISTIADEIVILYTMPSFPGISYFYDNFLQVDDNYVLHLLHQKNKHGS